MNDDDLDVSATRFARAGCFGKDNREARKKRERRVTRTPAEKARAKPEAEKKNKPVNFRTTEAFHASIMRWTKELKMKSAAALIETALTEYAKSKGLK